MDDAGTTIRLAGPPERIVSLVPSTTDILVALGAADRLVARTRYDGAPELASLPSVGGGLDPNIEAVASLRPDLVFAPGGEGARILANRLGAVGIPVHQERNGTIAEMRTMVLRIGTVLGTKGEARAARLLDSIDAAMTRVERTVSGRPAPSVLFLTWPDPPMIAGPGSFVDDLIRAAGGRNAFPDDGLTAWPQVAIEEVVARDPDVLLLPATENAFEPANHAGWRELTAVRTGRVYRIHPDLVSRPGPSLIEGVRTLATLLHPDAW